MHCRSGASGRSFLLLGLGDAPQCAGGGAGPHLSVVQVAEAADDLLLVQLVGLELHAPHRLHEAVVLQALLPGQLGPQRGALLQPVQLAPLHRNTHITAGEGGGEWSEVVY